MGDVVLERGEFGLVRQLAVHQQVGDLEEVRVSGQLFDRVAAIQQHALVAVDVGDGRFARGGGAETRVVGEAAGFLRQPGDVDAGVAKGAGLDRTNHGLVGGGQGYLDRKSTRLNSS